MSFSGLYAKMTEVQFGELMMRANAQAAEIIRLRRIADAARYPMLFRNGEGISIYDRYGGLPSNVVFHIMIGTWGFRSLPSECDKELENLVAPLLEHAETSTDKGAVRYVPAGVSTCDVVLATYSTVRAFLAKENAWSFLPLSRQHANAELWMTPSDNEEHTATNANYQHFGSMRITHQPAPAEDY
jgi:hypothetical protein